MSEPASEARDFQEVLPGVLHWQVHDDRIEAPSDAYAVVSPGGTVLVDPLPLAEDALSRFGSIVAICLTGSCHQRSAWRYRRRFGARVHAPAGAAGLEEAADLAYHDGYRLPGGLLAVHAPGPTLHHYAFLRGEGSGALFTADVLVRVGGPDLGFVPDSYQDDPARTRETARRLLDLRFTAVLPAHGAPVLEGGRQAIRAALGDRAGRGGVTNGPG